VEGVDGGPGRGPVRARPGGHIWPRRRQKHSEQVMYRRRKVIIEEIRSRQAKGITTPTTVEEVELIRHRGQLYQLLQVLLNRQNKERAS